MNETLSDRFHVRNRNAALIAVVAILLSYLVILVTYSSYSVGGSDSSGYLNLATLLGSGRVVQPIPLAEELSREGKEHVLIPLGFIRGPIAHSMSPYYPPGYPVHQLLLAWLVGWNYGPFLIGPVAATILLVVVFKLSREMGLTVGESVASSAILGLNPVFLFMALQPMSDIASALWCSLAILAALRSDRSRAAAVVAGLSLAIAICIRPSNAILSLPLVLALPMRFSRYVLVGLGAFPLLGLLLVYNSQVYGSALSTGYHADVARDFAVGFFRRRFDHYTAWLRRTYTPLIPIGWLVGVLVVPVPRRHRLLLAIWFAAYLSFFCFYRHFDLWWYLRFLLPGMPALIIGAVLASRRIREVLDLRLRLRGWSSPNGVRLLFLIAVLVGEVKQTRLQTVFDIGRSEGIYRAACLGANSVVPRKSVVVSMLMSGAVRYYSRLPCLRYDVRARDYTAVEARLRGLGYRVFALLHPAEVDKFRQDVGGNWMERGSFSGALLLEERPPD